MRDLGVDGGRPTSSQFTLKTYIPTRKANLHGAQSKASTNRFITLECLKRTVYLHFHERVTQSLYFYVIEILMITLFSNRFQNL